MYGPALLSSRKWNEIRYLYRDTTRIYVRHERGKFWWNQELLQPIVHGPFESIEAAKADVLAAWGGKLKVADFAFVRHYFTREQLERSWADTAKSIALSIT